jgi:FkbM family methyltransferase
VEVTSQLTRFGSGYGGYYVDTSRLSSNSIVYSLGVGEDVSFDLALIDWCGVEVHAFDPTPRVRTWLETQSLRPSFHFHGLGIADFDGYTEFYLPRNHEHVSLSLLRARQQSRDAVRLPVARLGTAMRQLRHARIDLLKMDIEGAEYGVLEEIVHNAIPVGQILVEFHHRFRSLGVSKTRSMLARLSKFGMEVAHVCPRCEVFTLVGVNHQCIEDRR